MAPLKISVELLEDVAHLGRKGEIIQVSAPQARHSLIPRGIVREVTAERMQKLEQDKKRMQDQARERRERAFDIQKELDTQELSFTLKGKGNKVFGGIAEHEIITAIDKKFGIRFEKKDIRLPNKAHIRTVGRHMVYIHITHDTIAKVFVTLTIEP